MTKLKLSYYFVGVLSLVWLVPGYSVTKQALEQGLPTLAPMLEQVTPAVVTINVTKSMPVAQEFSFEGQQIPDELRRFFGDRFNQPNLPNGDTPRNYAAGTGSGVILDSDNGYIVTNNHVVEGASEITVLLNDRRSFEAKLLGADPATDLALLQIDADNLHAITLADIDSVQIGDYAVAIGNPFGIGQTVTSGIISALGRSGLNTENYEDFIQTDAAINRGNSGGALVDLEGNLIGINTAIISGSGGSNGIGFAVPADMLASVVESLEQYGEVKRGVLGVTIIDVTPEVIEALELGTDRGALVMSVLPGSAAEKAGVQVSDVVTELDGKVIHGSRELRNSVGLLRQDEEVEMHINRGGQDIIVNTRIGDMQENMAAVISDRNPSEFKGATLNSVAGNSPDGKTGVEVLTVDPQSSAWASGLREGDVITKVNREDVRGLDEFNNIVDQSTGVKALTVMRQGRQMLLLLS